MRRIFPALIAVAAITLAAGAAHGAERSDIEPLRHCAGKVRSTSSSYGWRIRVKRMSCERAAQLIRDTPRTLPEDQGFNCELTERWRGVRVDCRKHSAIGTRRLIYLDSGR